MEVEMIENDNQLMALTELDRMLAQATNVEEVVDIRDKLRALEVYAKNIKASIEETNQYVAARIKAERKAGQLLPTKIKRGNLQGKNKDGNYLLKSSDSTLEKLGISKYHSSKWQALARIDNDVFDDELARLSTLGVELFTQHFADMARNAEMDEKRVQRVRDLSEIALIDGTYNVIYADPPWQYEHKVPTRAVENHYNTMPTEEIAAMPIDEIAADNSILFLWATSAMLPDAFTVLDDWGFIYKTSMVWVKDKIGLGWYTRGQHEYLLIATRGKFPPPPSQDRPSSVVMAERTDHSRKPLELYDIIEAMYPNGQYIELFARGKREGWEVWGSE
jgi:N6-adenosine-specific RNA methylase IME4